MLKGYDLVVADVRVVLHPVTFVLESGPARLVSLVQDGGEQLSRKVRGGVAETARALLEETLDDLVAGALADATEAARADLHRLGTQFLALAGAQPAGRAVDLVYTAAIPTPLAEEELDITRGSTYTWREINSSRGTRKPDGVPRHRSGTEALVLDYWRQAFEETDMGLDFLPQHLSLLQLRSLYDALWGYDQDPSGFKRWALDRKGAFHDLLTEVADPHDLDALFYESLGRRLPPELAAQAGAITAGALPRDLHPALGLPVAIAAAVTVNKLYKRRGPEPTWLEKSGDWRRGPTRLENLYPPRPAWTRWETRQGGDADGAVGAAAG
jgi:hypothetical protein